MKPPFYSQFNEFDEEAPGWYFADNCGIMYGPFDTESDAKDEYDFQKARE